MMLMSLEAVPRGVRGELTRWLVQLGPRLFIGSVKPSIRDSLWERVTRKSEAGAVIQAWSTRGEPGYALRVHGLSDRRLIEVEGVPLIAVRDAAWLKAIERFGSVGRETDT